MRKLHGCTFLSSYMSFLLPAVKVFGDVINIFN
jgi:hypothetical protein